MAAPEWIIEDYQDAQGRRPVDEFIDALPAKERVRTIRTIELFGTYGTDLGMPYARHLKGKLWELPISSGRLGYWVLYFARAGRRFVLLHIFRKKTQKTPRRETEIALRRMAELPDEER